MSFWTGLEALSGHRPGAFTGMTMKDLFDKDMWDRLPQTWSGKMGTPAHLQANPMDQRLSRGGEPMMTNWYNRNAARQTPTPVPQPAFSSPMRPEGALAGPPQYPQTRALAPRPNLNPTPLSPFIPGVSPTQGLDSIRHWGGGNPNQPGSMALDPTWAGGIRGAGLNALVTRPELRREPRWIDKTTTVKESAADDVPDTTTTVYKEKLDSAANWQPEAGAKARPFWGLQDRLQDWMGQLNAARRKRYEDSMTNRTWRGY